MLFRVESSNDLVALSHKDVCERLEINEDGHLAIAGRIIKSVTTASGHQYSLLSIGSGPMVERAGFVEKKGSKDEDYTLRLAGLLDENEIVTSPIVRMELIGGTTLTIGVENMLVEEAPVPQRRPLLRVVGGSQPPRPQ
jgi:hypothetical protein